MSNNTSSIVTGHSPCDIIRYAAEELKNSVYRLFGLRISIRDTIGTEDTAIVLDAAQARMDVPSNDVQGDDQSYVLRKRAANGKTVLGAFGATPTATLWAVYDLLERWGVRYLLRGDVYPVSSGTFRLPDVDTVRTPNVRHRGVRLLNLFSMGVESWGLADIKKYIDQLSKLRFNHVFHQLWCWQPYLHYECRGVGKCTGTHWFGWRYPIDEQTHGEHLFRSFGEFVPPDFRDCRTYAERVATGTNLVRESLRHAKRRGLHTAISTVLTDFTPEFAHLLGMPPVAPHGMGVALSGGHLGADHEGFQALCATALRAYVDTYPEADSIVISMPEFHAENVPYEAAWDRLNRKYDLDSVCTLRHALEQAATRTDYPGGPERIAKAVKGDIVAFDLFDRLLNEKKVLADCSNPQANILFTNVSEELAEVYSRMRPGVAFPCSLDYTSSRMAKRPDAFERIGRSGLRPVLTMTTQDDNIGVVPQLTSASTHQLLEMLRRYGWEGFQLRYWMISDMEPTVAYLSAACWDASVTCDTAYRDHAESLCGAHATDDLTSCLRILDEITIGLGDHGLGIGFPVPEMGVRHWYSGGKLSSELVHDRGEYRNALCLAIRARERASRGHQYIEYLIGRLEFGIGYLDMIEALREAGNANREGKGDLALERLQRGVALAHAAVESYARVAMPSYDLGALAQLDEDLCRKLSRLLTEVRAGKSWTLSTETTTGGVLVDSDTE